MVSTHSRPHEKKEFCEVPETKNQRIFALKFYSNEAESLEKSEYTRYLRNEVWKVGEGSLEKITTSSEEELEAGAMAVVESSSMVLCTYTNSTDFYGGWKDGKMYCRGTFNYANGSEYVGEWVGDGMNGLAYLIFY